MGLDMYLNYEVYVGGKYKNVDGTITVPSGGSFLQKEDMNLNLKDITSITLELGYWRKANAIHKWFVDKMADGVDECQRIPVNQSNLKELKEICQKVVKEKKDTTSRRLLPTGSGFFFGDTEYGEYYYEDVEDTIKIIDAALEKTKGLLGDFFYQASW